MKASWILVLVALLCLPVCFDLPAAHAWADAGHAGVSPGTQAYYEIVPPAITVTSRSAVARPNIIVQSATISSYRVAPGVPVFVIANIANIGAADGSALIQLFVNGLEVEEQEVTLPGGSQFPLKFTLRCPYPGTYSVYVQDTPAGDFQVDPFADTRIILYIGGALLLFALIACTLFMQKGKRG